VEPFEEGGCRIFPSEEDEEDDDLEFPLLIHTERRDINTLVQEVESAEEVVRRGLPDVDWKCSMAFKVEEEVYDLDTPFGYVKR
jgi:hypothetical protein